MTQHEETIQLDPGDSYIVASMELWEHIVTTYNLVGEDQPKEIREQWEDCATAIDEQSREHHYKG